MNDFTQLADLASERLGGRVIEANDDFFAPKENLLKEAKPIFIEGKYTSRGKWMDGWETRRRRTPGFDWCLIRLGLPGAIRGIVVDTSFFTGNYPERFSLEGCDLGTRHPYKNEKPRLHSKKTRWHTILPETPLQGDSRNFFLVDSTQRLTHLRLKIYPDGGIARLRVHGEVLPDIHRMPKTEIDLVAVNNGGSVVTSSDHFYGEPRNLLMPYPAKNMGDGWETKRRRSPGHDWVILKLGLPGKIQRVEVNTAHFKGNFPDTCSLETCISRNLDPTGFHPDSESWNEILPPSKLKANYRHRFKISRSPHAATHVRFNIYPDGGVSRLRLFGHPEVSSPEASPLEKFNRMTIPAALKTLLDCCGSKEWAMQLAAKRPFSHLEDFLRSADQIWAALSPAGWQEAFRHHPPIGGSSARKKQSVVASTWSAKEQSTAQSAPPEVLASLAAANHDYLKKFGYVFLICATGKSGEEILAALRHRLPNDPESELRIAAEEQRKITRLRLEKLLKS